MDAFPDEEKNTTPSPHTIETELDIVKARQLIRLISREAGMSIVDQTRVTTAVSELLRNMYQFAGGGEVFIEKGEHEGRQALIVTCIDNGPGIADLRQAMTDGFTSGGGMGLGLPGAKRLVDSFHIESKINEGTLIRVAKWI
ncbi:MAG: anti-sigma regulatory factor [Deltaproteobacteria bacterium]|nr:anti-sigma regulatory factor [Deltaproteobacteria bacterium]